MAYDFNINISGQLSKETKKHINDQLKAMKLNNVNTITMGIDTKTTRARIKAQLDSIKVTKKLDLRVIIAEDKKAKEMTNALKNTYRDIDKIKIKGVDITRQEVSVNGELAKKKRVIIGLDEKRYTLSQRILGNGALTAPVKTVTTKMGEDPVKLRLQYSKLNEELIKLKGSTEAAANVTRKYGKASDAHHAKVKTLMGSIRKLNIVQGQSPEQMNKTIATAKRLRDELNNVSKVAKGTGKSSLGMGEMFKTAFKSFSVWIGVTSIFFGAVQQIKDGIGAVKELDDAMLELRKVSDLSSSGLEAFNIQAQETGTVVGQTTSEVIRATAQFAKMGYTVVQALDLAQSALILTNVADGIDTATESADALIATLKGFRMEASQSTHIVDALNEVSNNFAVSTDALADGIRRVSSVYKDSNDTFEQTLGLLTAGIEVIQNTEKVSSGLIVIAQRLRGISESGEEIDGLASTLQGAFKSMAGVDVQNADGSLRNIYDIMQDLSVVMPTLSDETRQYLGELSAGKRQIAVFNSILGNFATAQKSATTALNSQGSALKENEKYLDSITGKFEMFKKALQDLWTNAINSESIKIILDLGTGVLKFVDALGALNTVALITVGILGAKGMLGVAFKGAIIIFAQYIWGATASTAATLGLTTALSTLAPVAVVLGLILIGKGIIHIATASKRATEETKKFIEATNQTIASLSEEKDELIKLSYEYDRLKTKQKNLTATADEKIRLLEIQKELVTQYDVSITGIDAEGQAYSDSIVLIKLRTKALEDELVAEQAKLETAVKSMDIDQVSDLEDNIAKRIRLKNQLLEEQKKIDDYESTLQNKGSFTVGGVYGSVVVDANAENGANLIKQYIQNANSYKDDFQTALTDVNNAIIAGTADRQQLLQNDATSTIKLLESSGAKVSDGARAFASEFAKALSVQPEDIATQRDALKTFTDELNSSDFDDLSEKYKSFVSKNDTAGIDATSKAIMKLVESFTEGMPELDTFYLTMESIYGDSSTLSKANTSIFPMFMSNMKELTGIFSEGTSELKGLNNVLDTVAKGESLSSDMIADLIVKYPDLTGAISETADGYTIESYALEILRQARIKEQVTAVETQAGITASTKAELGKRLSIYGIELSAIKTLDDAKKASAGIRSPYGVNNAEADFYFSDIEKSLYSYGTALDFVASLEDKLRDPDYGVTLQSKGKTSKEKEADVLKEYFHQLDAISKLESSLAMSKTKAELEGIDLSQEQLDMIDAIQAKKHNLAVDMDADIVKLEKRVALGGDNVALIEQLATLEGSRVQLSQDWLELEQDGKDILEGQKEVLLKQKEAFKTTLELAKEVNQSKLDGISEVEDKIVEIIKQRYATEKELLDDQLEDFKSFIEGKKDILSDQYSEEDYQKKQSEQSAKIMAIQTDIAEYSIAANSNDMEAISKVSDLNKDLEEEKKSLSELQYDREKKLRENNLDDELKAVEDITRKKKSAIDEKLKDDKLYAEARLVIENSSVLELTEMYTTFENTFGKGMSLLGSIIKANFTDKIREAKDSFIEMNSLIMSNLQLNDTKPQTKEKETNNPFKDKGMSFDDFAVYKQNKKDYTEGNRKDEASKQNAEMRLDYSIESDTFTYDQIKGYYKDGGVNDYTGLAQMHGNPSSVETIFNAQEGKKLLSLVKNLPNFSAFGRQGFKLDLPQVSPSNKVKTPIQINNKFDITISGDASRGTMNTMAEKVSKSIEKTMYTMGF